MNNNNVKPPSFPCRRRSASAAPAAAERLHPHGALLLLVFALVLVCGALAEEVVIGGREQVWKCKFNKCCLKMKFLATMKANCYSFCRISPESYH